MTYNELISIMGKNGGIHQAFTRLAWGIAHNAGTNGQPMRRSEAVHNATGLGSGVSAALCVLADADPDEMVGGAEC